jgi:hypothetical protein
MKDWTLTRASKAERVAPLQACAEVHRSLAVQALLDDLRGEGGRRVLDLGAASGINVEFLSQFASRIQIEDLYGTLVAAGFPRESTEPDDPFPFPALLPFAEGSLFDVVLVWDLFDYLDRANIGALVRHLHSFSNRGAYLLALSSTLKEIPARPIRFRFLDRQTLRYERDSDEMRAAPRYTPRDFTQMMAGFRVQHSFLLKHGVQEYLFVRE